MSRRLVSGVVTRLLPAISPTSRVLALGVMIVLCVLVLAPPAHAIYGPAAGGLGAEIVSVDNASDEQGDASTVEAAISANGRYVVFQTRATNFFEDDGVSGGDPEPPGTLREGGIFRYDRDTGELALVADGSEVHTEGSEAGKLIFRGAENPSISANGRYIAFSTAQQLVPQDTNENIDVYVRDMDVPLTADRQESGAYTLVSAKSGGEEPATYTPPSPPLPGENPGAEVWPDTAISADGRYVLFRTTELGASEQPKSDLPDQPVAETSPRQLFVRDLQAKTTTLVSRKKKGEPEEGGPAGGAIGPASISADGSTVAWVSTDAPVQTRFLPGEVEDPSQAYYLWRRWQEPAPLTRRITGIADPEDAECYEGEGINPADQTTTGPCYGPLSEQEASLASIDGADPALSADGYTVAFLAGAALRPNITKERGLDIFLTSMVPGVTRKAGTRELTLAVNSGAQGSTPSIESLALSPDGSTIAFTSLRDSFVLPEPQPIGAFRPLPTASDLYVIHLGANTLERAVVGYEGSDPNGSVSIDPTLTQEGSAVAFVSAASNLIYGDANGFPDAFVATLQAPGGTGAPPAGANAGSGGFSLSAVASPELGVSVRRAKDGGVILLVETPGPGKLTAKARGSIPKATSGKRAKKAGASSAVAGGSKKTVKKKTALPVLLASVSATARSEGTTTLTLHLSSKYAKDLQRAGKLEADITIDFVPTTPAESSLTDEVSATFVTASPAKRSSGKGKGGSKKA
jgi:Tol biopolymer transport system component